MRAEGSHQPNMKAFTHGFASMLFILLTLLSNVQAQSASQQANSLASEAASLFTLLAGEGYSIYTELTALIGAAGTAAETIPTDSAIPSATPTTPTTTSIAPSTSIRSFVRPTPSSLNSALSSLRSVTTSSSATRARPILPSSVAAAAASTSGINGLGPPDKASSNYLTAILVGSLLGALALGLLALLLLWCRGRRRRDHEREGGITPTSDEVRSWIDTHGRTSYAPITEFGQDDDPQAEKAMATVGVVSVNDSHRSVVREGSDTHPAYRDMDTHDLVRNRTQLALMKEMDIDGAGAMLADQLPGQRSPKRRRHSIPRKPVPKTVSESVPVTGTSGDRARKPRSARALETEYLISPIDADTNGMGQHTSVNKPQHLHHDSRDALLADTDDPAVGNERPSLERDDSFTAALPQPLQPRQSTYTAYRPGVSASPYGPSPTHPAAAVIAAYRNQDRDIPNVPPRSPKRRSYGHTPSLESSTESLGRYARRRQSVDAEDERANSRRRSSESPRLPPEGVTYHDFVPVKRSPRSSVAPAAAWGAVRGREVGRR